MARLRALLPAAAAALIAGAALAAQDPPPPNLQSEDSILKWAKDAKLTDDTANPAGQWSILGALDDGLLWSSTSGPDAQGVAKVGVRLERFRPNGGVRSEAEMYELNCQTQQVRGTFNAAFAEHNFRGAKTDRAVNSAWTPVAGNEVVSAVKDDACKAKTGNATAAAANAPAVNINDPAALRAFITSAGILDRNVGNSSDPWAMLGANNDGVVYSVLARRNDQTRYAWMLVRTERFTPGPNPNITAFKSQTEEFEINCNNNRVRSVGVMRYADHNLQGRTDGERKLSEWTPVAQHLTLAKAGQDLCREFQVRRDFQNGDR